MWIHASLVALGLGALALACSRDTATTASPLAPESGSSGPVAGPQQPSVAPNLSAERRKKDLREVVDDNTGFAHLTRGMNARTVEALLNESQGSDLELLAELLLDRDSVVAMTAAEVLLRIGPAGVAKLVAVNGALPPDADPQRQHLIAERVAMSRSLAREVDPAGDPFEQPARGTSPNCGPDERKRFAILAQSKDDVIRFLQQQARWVSNWMRLDDYQKDGMLEWARVADQLATTTLGSRTVYQLAFKPKSCSGFTFRMTNDGYTSLYGCCGK